MSLAPPRHQSENDLVADTPDDSVAAAAVPVSIVVVVVAAAASIVADTSATTIGTAVTATTIDVATLFLCC